MVQILKMKLLISLTVLVIVLPLCGATQTEAIKRQLADFSQPNILQDYLNGKIFGDNPGPCPNFDDCTGNWDNLPGYIKNINPNLDLKSGGSGCTCGPGCNSFCSNGGCACGFLCTAEILGFCTNGGYRANTVTLSPQPTLGDIVKGGIFDVWELEVDGIELNQIDLDDLDYLTGSSNSIHQSRVGVQNLKLGSTAMIRAVDLKIVLENIWYGNFDDSYVGDLTFNLGTPSDPFVIDKFESALTLDKTVLTGNNGIQATFNLRFSAIQGKTLNDDFPYRFDFKDESGSTEIMQLNAQSDCDGTGSCCIVLPEGQFIKLANNDVDIDLGLPAIFDPIIGFITNFVVDLVINVILAAVKGLIETIACEIITQLAFIKDDFGVPDPNELGGINLGIDYFYNNVSEWKQQGLKTPEQIRDDELNLLSPSGPIFDQIEPAKAVNFKTDEFFEGLSFGINKILGDNSSNPNYDLVVNEVVDLLLNDTDGIFEISDFKDFTKEDTYPSSNFYTDATSVDFKLKSFAVGGLNTFEELIVLDNGFTEIPIDPSKQYNHTLKNEIKLKEITVDFSASVQFLPEKWVKGNLDPSAEETFDISLKINDIDLTIDAFLLLQPQLLLEVQVGQVLGPNTSLYNCTGRLLDHLFISSAALSFSSIEGPIITGGLGPLGELVEDGAVIFNKVTKGGLEVNLPFIVEGFLRPEFNSILETLFLDEDICEDYIPQVYEEQYFQVANTISYGFVSTLLERVIGGDPINDNDADINSIIDTLIQYYLIDSTELPIPELRKIDRGDYEYVYLVDFILDTQSNSDFIDGSFGPIRISNIDSISRLLVGTVKDTNDEIDPYSADVSLQIGYYSDPNMVKQKVVHPLILSFPVKIQSTVSNVVEALEDFEFQLNLSIGVDFTVGAQIDKDLTYQLTFGELQNAACLFAITDEKNLSKFEITLVDFTFGLVGTFSSSQLGNSLQVFSDDLVADQTLLGNFLNYLFNRIEEETIAFVNQDLDGYDISTCAEVESPLSNSSLGTGLPIPDFENINKFFDDLLEPQENPRLVESAAEFEDGIVPNKIDENGNVVLDTEGNPVKENVFDITNENNAFLQIVATGITPQSIETAIITIANTTLDPNVSSIFDPLLPYFRLEDDDSVSFVYDLSDLNYDPQPEGLIEGFKFLFRPLVVRNIQTFTSAKILEPFKDAKFTTIHEFIYNNPIPLTVEFGFDIEVAGKVVGRPEPVLFQSLNSSLNLNLVAIELMTTLAVKTDALKPIEIGDILEFNTTTQLFQLRQEGYECVLPKTIFPGGLTLQQLNVSVNEDDITSPETTISGDLFTDSFIDVFDSFFEIFIGIFSKQLPNIAQGAARNFINDKITEELLKVEDKVCEIYTVPDWSVLTTGKIFNFAESPFDEDLNNFIQNDLLNSQKPLYINQLLKGAGIVQDGVGLTEVLDKFQIEYGGQDLGRVSVSVGDFQLEDLGNPQAGGAIIKNLQLLDNSPFSSSTVGTRNSIKFEGDLNIQLRLAYAFDKLFTGDGYGKPKGDGEFMDHLSDTDLYNDFKVGLIVTDLFMELDLDIALDLENFLSAKAGNLLDLYAKPSGVSCYLSIFDSGGLVPQAFNISFSSIALSIECESACDSPIFDGIIGKVTSSQEFNERFTAGTDTAIQVLSALIAESDAQSYLDLAIDTAREECIGVSFLANFTLPEPAPIIHAALYMFYAAIGILFVAIVGFSTCLPKHKKRAAAIYIKANENKLDLDLVRRKLLPLIRHPEVTPVAKIAVPLSLFVAMIFFVTANFFTNGATVVLKLNIFGDETIPIDLLPFTLEISIDDAWNSEAYPLALAIAIASGFWPYTKLILLNFCWLAPVTVLSVKNRGSLADILDALGKWSLIDAYVLIVLQVGFRFYITSNTISILEFLPEDLLIVDVAVIPGFGIYGFLTGTIISLIVNHFIIYNHHKVVDKDEEFENSMKGWADTSKLGTRKARLCKHRFFLEDDNYSYGYSRGIQVVAIFLVGLSSIMCVGGLFVPLLRLDFGGVVGFGLSLIDPTSTYSVNSAVDIVPLVAEGQPEDAGSQFGIVFLQLTYIIFVAATPILLITVFAIIFFANLRLNEQKKLFVLAEIIFAWEALIILIVSCYGAVFQIGQLASFIANAATADLCKFLEEQLLAIGFDESDAKCLDVVASVEGTGYILVFGTFFLVSTSIVMFRLCREAIHDRELLQKYIIAKKAKQYEQMESIKRRAKVPTTHKGFILGPLMRGSCQRFKKRKGGTGKIYGDAKSVVTLSTSNPTFQSATRVEDEDDIEV